MSINWKQCILCQSDDDMEQLVQHPRVDSYQRLEMVEERASLHDGNYVGVQKRLHGCTKDTLYADALMQLTKTISNVPETVMLRASTLPGNVDRKEEALKWTNQPINIWLFNTIHEIRYKSTG